MIRVDRNRLENGKPIKPPKQWFRKAKEKTGEAIKQGPDHTISDLYRDTRIKAALEKLFHDKCAYCESRFSPGDWDVDHYRPKGRVAERPDHPGYYWLAYKWENLYPSCKSCNQKRKDHPRFDEPGELPSKGKLDQFPVENEEQRAMVPGDNLDLEHPLLVDPCNSEPGKHFAYDIQGQIHPKEPNDRAASETIRICHLQRRRLRDDRARTILRVSKVIETIHLAKESGNRKIEQELNDILSGFLASSSIFAGAARAVNENPNAFCINRGM